MVKAISKIAKDLPGSFAKTLDEHMKRLKMTNEKLANECLISPDVIRRFRNDKNTPKLPTVIALCVGLKLHPILGNDLVRKAGFTFTASERDVAYQLILGSR